MITQMTTAVRTHLPATLLVIVGIIVMILVTSRLLVAVKIVEITAAILLGGTRALLPATHQVKTVEIIAAILAVIRLPMEAIHPLVTVEEEIRLLITMGEVQMFLSTAMFPAEVGHLLAVPVPALEEAHLLH